MTMMRLALPSILLPAFLSLVPGGQAAAPRTSQIGYVSAQRILTDSAAGKADVARVQTMQQQRATELRAKQQTLEATRQQLIQASDASARGQLQQQEQQQRIELERASTQAQTDLQALQRQMQVDMQTRVKSVMDDVVKGQNIQVVLNGDTSVVWAAPGLDLTAAVIERMNAQPAAAKPQ